MNNLKLKGLVISGLMLIGAFVQAGVLMRKDALHVSTGGAAGNGKVSSAVQGPVRTKMKALIVVTSHDQLGDTGRKTGYYLSEVTHPFFELLGAGFDVDIASPKGGEAPMDERSNNLSDETNRRFMETAEYAGLLRKTVSLTQIIPEKYTAVLFAGGHGTMWDFPDSADIQRIVSAIWARGGVVAAVCHGPAALVNIRLPDGRFLIGGKQVTGFTNEEEEAAKLTRVMPFPLETRIIERGARFEKAAVWQAKVVTDGRLITGQNPASAAKVGKEIARVAKETALDPLPVGD